MNNKLIKVGSKLNKLFSGASETLKPFESIPGPKGLPWIGNMWRYIPLIGDYDVNELYENAKFNRKKYGPIVREKISDKLTVLHLFDPNDIESLFRQDDKLPSRRSFIAMLKYRLERPDRYLDGGIVPENGERWFRQRSQFQKRMLSKPIVSSYTSKIDEATLKTIRDLRKKFGDRNEIDISDFEIVFNSWSLRCIASLFLDCDIDELDETKFKRLLKEIDNTLIATHGTELISSKWMNQPEKCKYYQLLIKSQDFLYDFASTQIDKSIQGDRSSHSMVHDWIYKDKIDRKDVISFVMDAFLGGVHTTGYTLAHLFYYVAKYPEYQSLLHEEIDKEQLSSSELLSADNIENLKLLKLCLTETLRLNPASTGTGRLTTRDMNLRGYHIPEGTMIIAHNQTISRDGNYFEDPDKFVPHRWQKYRSCPRHERPSPFAFRPFGFGARACIAQRIIDLEMRILASRFLQNFHISETTEIATKTMVVHTLNGNFGIKIKKRQ